MLLPIVTTFCPINRKRQRKKSGLFNLIFAPLKEAILYNEFKIYVDIQQIPQCFTLNVDEIVDQLQKSQVIVQSTFSSFLVAKSSAVNLKRGPDFHTNKFQDYSKLSILRRTRSQDIRKLGQKFPTLKKLCSQFGFNLCIELTLYTFFFL